MQQFQCKQFMLYVLIGFMPIQHVKANEPESALDQVRLVSHSVNNITVIDGDVLSGSHPMQRGRGTRQATELWADGVMPYYIGPELQTYLERGISSAIEGWNEVARITLVQIDSRRRSAPVD